MKLITNVTALTLILGFLAGDPASAGTPEAPDEEPPRFHDLNLRQVSLLDLAYLIATEDRHKNPRYLQGLIMQESSAGAAPRYRVVAGPGPKDRQYGVGQVTMPAARAVMQRYPELWSYLDTRTDEELQARLILDDEFNIRVTSKYALIVGINENPTRGITAYNLGLGGVKDVDPAQHVYTRQVKQYTARLTKRLSY